MTDHANDIDALLRWCDYSKSHSWHAAITALVAERDALRKENDELRSRCKVKQDEVLDRVFAMDAMRKRIAELESQSPATSDLRERDEAMTRWMDQVTAMLCHSMTHSHDAKQELVARCDKAIDAMRKENTNV